MPEHEIDLPLHKGRPPLTLNQRIHWAEKNRHTRNIRESVGWHEAPSRAAAAPRRHPRPKRHDHAGQQEAHPASYPGYRADNRTPGRLRGQRRRRRLLLHLQLPVPPMTARRDDTFGAIVGSRLRALRKDRGLNQAEVAQRMGLHVDAVSQIERLGRDLRVDTVRRYCAAIGARIHIGLVEEAHTDGSSKEGP